MQPKKSGSDPSSPDFYAALLILGNYNLERFESVYTDWWSEYCISGV